jgi:WD40-like Beta Propeller Repeat
MESPVLGVVLDSSVLVAAEGRKLTVAEIIEIVQRDIGELPIVVSPVTIAEVGHGIYRANATELRASRLSLFAVLLLVAAFSASTLNAAGGETGFAAAYYHSNSAAQSILTLFPLMSGKETDVALPAGLANHNLISFGPDGRSVYLQQPSSSSALVKVEFNPLRQSQVRGSAGLGDIYGLTVSTESGRLYGWASLGAYEIDPDAGTHRPLRFAKGPICPDGKHAVSNDGKHLSLVDLETGSTQPLGEGRSGSWSPDGRWIATAGFGRIVLIDANNPSHRKKLGSSGVDNHLIWSPDSKHLLFVKQEQRCNFLFLFQVDDSESLEIVDVETGRRRAIPSGHCAVTSSAVGWVDATTVR